LCVPYPCVKYVTLTRLANKCTFINMFNHVLFFTKMFRLLLRSSCNKNTIITRIKNVHKCEKTSWCYAWFSIAFFMVIIFFLQCHHMSLMGLVVFPPGCGRSVTDFWAWYAHEAQLRCAAEVDGDTWIWSTRRGLNLSSTKLHRPWSPWESSPSRKNPHGRVGNRARGLMIRSQKLWPLDHEAGLVIKYKNMLSLKYS
jgi:hypothetical protein